MELYSVFNEDCNSIPVVVSIPHSGRYVPPEIRSTFDKNAVLTNMDWYLDIFYEFFNTLGVTTIIANYSRYVIDLNRGLNLHRNKGDYKNTLVYTETTFGQPLYTSPPDNDEINLRIDKYYTPYYNKLDALIEHKLKSFGKTYLFDMHSFFEQTNEDICLSNADNATSTEKTITNLKNHFIANGFTVDINNVFKGGRLIRRVKERFANNIECVAVELFYKSYLEDRFFHMEEVTKWDCELFSNAQTRMKQVFQEFFTSF